MELHLEAHTEAEKRVKAYLEDNASEALAEKINAGKKTLGGFFRYAKDQARAKAVNGCACIDDKTVFGWAIHYFEEKTIKESQAPKAEKTKEERKAAKIEASKRASKTVTTEREPKKKDKQADGQLDLFSLIGGEA